MSGGCHDLHNDFQSVKETSMEFSPSIPTNMDIAQHILELKKIGFFER